MQFLKKILILITYFCYIKSIKNPTNIWEGNSSKLPDKHILSILQSHNNYRSQIANGEAKSNTENLPKSANMVQLYWHETLARNAQIWANNCEYKNSGEQLRSIAGKFIGENIFKTTTSGEIKPDLMDWDGIIQKWQEESKKFSIKDIYPFQPSEKYKNFSQLAWANSLYVGCGYSAYKNKNGDTNQLYVCQYSPGGNILINELYNEGEVCSNCPTGYLCKSEYKGLCCVEKFCMKDSISIKKRLKYKLK